MELPPKSDRSLQMLAELAELAKPYVNIPDGQFVLLPIDPVTYPAQRSYHLDSIPQPPAFVTMVATSAESRFPVMQAQLDQDETEHKSISNIGEHLKAGDNVIIATNHGDLIDIALVQAAFYNLLTNHSYMFKSGIIISKMVALLGYKLGEEATPATDLLKLLCNDIFLSFPRTESVRNSRLGKLLPGEINLHNTQLTHLIHRRLDEGRSLLAIAPSGTTDKPLASDSTTYRLGSLSRGTIKLMKHERTFVVPIAVWLKGTEPFIKVCDIPRRITDEASAHSVMHTLATTLTDNIEGRSFIYQPQRDLGKAALGPSRII